MYKLNDIELTRLVNRIAKGNNRTEVLELSLHFAQCKPLSSLAW